MPLENCPILYRKSSCLSQIAAVLSTEQWETGAAKFPAVDLWVRTQCDKAGFARKEQEHLSSPTLTVGQPQNIKGLMLVSRRSWQLREGSSAEALTCLLPRGKEEAH